MFESTRIRWREARAAKLKEEFVDASRRISAFSDETAERFGRALDHAFNHWVKKIMVPLRNARKSLERAQQKN